MLCKNIFRFLHVFSRVLEILIKLCQNILENHYKKSEFFKKFFNIFIFQFQMAKLNHFVWFHGVFHSQLLKSIFMHLCDLFCFKAKLCELKYPFLISTFFSNFITLSLYPTTSYQFFVIFFRNSFPMKNLLYQPFPCNKLITVNISCNHKCLFF